MEYSYWHIIWNQFRKNTIGVIALIVFLIFVLAGLYAPFLASSKPLFVMYHGEAFFPLFRYLFYHGFFTKRLDLFYNVLMFIFPLMLLSCFLLKGKRLVFSLLGLCILQLLFFTIFSLGVIKNPASTPLLNIQRYEALKKATDTNGNKDPLLAGFKSYPDWNFELKYMNSYEKLNLVLQYYEQKKQNEKLQPYEKAYFDAYGRKMPTLWEVNKQNIQNEIKRLQLTLKESQTKYEKAIKDYPLLLHQYKQWSKDTTKEELSLVKGIIQNYRDAQSKLLLIEQREKWLSSELEYLKDLVMPLIRPFHWEDDAGGEQKINQFIPWWELSRINRKDLVAALIFGIRISLVVGITAVAIALIIGIPIGTFSGYFAGKWDIAIFRLIEIWEAMPVFFMLLFIVAITQSKSIFLVIATIGIFGWTGFSRFIRGEVLRQRNLPYVLACHNLGFNHPKIMFSHILPNAIPPILTLLPFSMMSAITSEAALSFLGLGEEGSCSWGVLMDEGRSVFPGESYLLWPPAILLTILLISIALVGDALRDAIDPKLHT